MSTLRSLPGAPQPPRPHMNPMSWGCAAFVVLAGLALVLAAAALLVQALGGAA